MSRKLAVAIAIVGVLVTLAYMSGCGGGEGNPPAPGPGDTSSIRGSVDTAAGSSYEVLLDGRAVPGAMQADGSFEINGVPPGEHRVAVVEAGGLAGSYVSVVVRAGEDTQVPPIVPELGGQIVGMVTVRDEGGLRPLPDVEVTAQPADEVVALAAKGDEGGPNVSPPDVPAFSAFTDEHGSYIIQAVPEGSYVVTVAAPEYEDNSRWTWVEAGHTAVADFELRPAIDPGVGTVRGRVVTETDGGAQPIEGATVTISSDEPWFAEPPSLDGDGSEPASEEGEDGDSGCDNCPEPPDEMPPPWFYGVSTLTDSDGNYSLNAPAGYGSIEVFAPEYMPVWEEIVIQADQVLERNFTLEPWPDEPPFPPPGPGPVPVPEPEPE